MAGSEPFPVQGTVGAVLPSCPPPPAGIAAIHKGCAQSGKHHAAARGPSCITGGHLLLSVTSITPSTFAHGYTQTSPNSCCRQITRSCRWPNAQWAGLCFCRAWGSDEEGAGNSRTELLPSFQGGVAGGLPKGRMSRQQRRGLLRAQAAASALSNGPAGHPSSFLHLGLLTDMCFLCEKRCRVFFWLLQWLFNDALILYPVCYK